MKLKPLTIYALMLVMSVHTLLLVDALTLGLFVPAAWAEEAPAETAEPGDEGAPTDAASPGSIATPERETYLELIEELRSQKRALDERAEILEARERRFALVETEIDRDRESLESERQRIEERSAESSRSRGAEFERLLKAYAAMEAENAAGALEALHGRKKQVVVDLLLGLNARQAGAALDALAARNPSIAAELSLAIWQKGETR